MEPGERARTAVVLKPSAVELRALLGPACRRPIWFTRVGDDRALHTGLWGIEDDPGGAIRYAGLQPGDYELNFHVEGGEALVSFRMPDTNLDLGEIDVRGLLEHGDCSARVELDSDAVPPTRFKLLWRARRWPARLWRVTWIETYDHAAAPKNTAVLTGLPEGEYDFAFSLLGIGQADRDLSAIATASLRSGAADPERVVLAAPRR